MDLGYSIFYKCFLESGLRFIEPIIKNEKPNVFQFAGAASVYNCLKWFEEEEPISPDFIFIDNKELKPQLVLIEVKEDILFGGYGDYGELDTVYTINDARKRGVVQRIFTCRYLLFARMSVLPKPSRYSDVPSLLRNL